MKRQYRERPASLQLEKPRASSMHAAPDHIVDSLPGTISIPVLSRNANPSTFAPADPRGDSRLEEHRTARGNRRHSFLAERDRIHHQRDPIPFTRILYNVQ